MPLKVYEASPEELVDLGISPCRNARWRDVKLHPDHWRALQGIGVVFDRLGRREDATAAHQKAREAERR